MMQYSRQIDLGKFNILEIEIIAEYNDHDQTLPKALYKLFLRHRTFERTDFLHWNGRPGVLLHSWGYIGNI